jgi:glucosylceramidase
VLVDTHGGKVLYQSSFYAIAHFSRYVKPGAHRVELSGAPRGLQSSAFANPDGSIAVVAFNPGDAAVDFNLDIAGEKRGCRIPAHAIQTYLA